MTDKKRRRNDYVVIVLLFLIPLLFLLAFYAGRNNSTADSVSIEVNNETYGIYPLNVDREIHLHDDKIDNLVVIKNGEVFISEANCKDQICVFHSPISKQGEQIVCLPNKVVVEIISSEKNIIDSLSQ
ncbi:MAG: NusG domain II-containing protein [Clostridia bacterium]|nr:NusG domain II-containing protein [Clostridia bacterium]